jgi:hypothetical protein
VALYFMWYNFGRIHQTLKMTPAMAAGIASKPWTVRADRRANRWLKLTHYPKT